jgi:hypothetical protein
MFSEGFALLATNIIPSVAFGCFYLLANTFFRHSLLVWTLIAFAGLLFILHAPDTIRFACFVASCANNILGPWTCKRVIAFSNGILLVGFRRGIGAKVPGVWQFFFFLSVRFVDKKRC